MVKIAPELREVIRKKQNASVGYTQIANELGVAPSAARYWADPNYRKKALKRASNPKLKKYRRKYYQERRKDPEFRKRVNEAAVRFYRKHRKAVRAKQNRWQREKYHTDPEFREKRKAMDRERYHTNPEYRERIKTRVREYRKQKRCHKAHAPIQKNIVNVVKS